MTSLTLLVPSTAFRTHLAGPSLLGADNDAIVLYFHRTRGFMATAPGKMRLAVKIIYWRDVDKALLIANSKLKGTLPPFFPTQGTITVYSELEGERERDIGRSFNVTCLTATS